MIHLQSIQLNLPPEQAEVFPFHIPAIRSLTTLAFTTPVTFLVGENGSGKSSLLEALALAAGSIVAGSSELGGDESLNGVKPLAHRLKLTWSKRTRKGFFLRSEDYFGYVRRLARMRQELERDLREVDTDYKGRSQYARDLASLPYRRELHDLNHQYGGDLDSRSHGESFLSFFQARFVPDGLYLLDEPEAPLSPLRQMSLIALLKTMVNDHNAQFIIATHSPILMAFPGATILNFDAAPIASVAYDDLEHVRLTRDFLNNPAQFLKHL